MSKIIGHDRDKLIGLNYKEYIDPENTEKVVKIFKEVYETGIPAQAFDWKILRKDGTVRCIEPSVFLKRNKTGKPMGFLGIARDVTGARLKDKALRGHRFICG
jgi:PAS domain S-box-containing protein